MDEPCLLQGKQTITVNQCPALATYHFREFNRCLVGDMGSSSVRRFKEVRNTVIIDDAAALRSLSGIR